MSAGLRGVRSAARSWRRAPRFQQPAPRNAGGHAHGGEHHHGESAFHVTAGSGNESFGRGFYISVASVPLAIMIYSVASSPGDNVISRLVKNYEEAQADVERSNVIHTTMVEAAAADRQLFASSPRDMSGAPVRNQEFFNAGSPWNVSAGQGTADLAEVARFYEAKNKQAEEDRIERQKKLRGSLYD